MPTLLTSGVLLYLLKKTPFNLPKKRTNSTLHPAKHVATLHRPRAPSLSSSLSPPPPAGLLTAPSFPFHPLDQSLCLFLLLPFPSSHNSQDKKKKEIRESNRHADQPKISQGGLSPLLLSKATNRKSVSRASRCSGVRSVSVGAQPGRWLMGD